VAIRAAPDNPYHLSNLFLIMSNGGVFSGTKASDQAREDVKQNKYVKKIVTFVRAVKKACPGFR